MRAFALAASGTCVVGAVLAIAGCSKGVQGSESGRGGLLSTDGRFSVAASSRSGGSAKGFRGSDLAARSLASSGGLNAGLMLGRRARGPEATPLDELLREGDRPLGNNGLCPADMASIDDLFCVDRFEGSLVELLANGDERGFSPYEAATGRTVRALSERHVVPQGYISADQAGEACARSGKRLCKPLEWRKACRGPSSKTYGYGEKREAGRCNDHGKSAMGSLYGAAPRGAGRRAFWSPEKMNNPALNQVAGTVAKSGDHEGCTNGYGVFDMVGNLHEWVADPNGTFQGGYYLDTNMNGEGCSYRTTAHSSDYHDYSTGFRCCSDPAP